jgi:hypothetical protein
MRRQHGVLDRFTRSDNDAMEIVASSWSIFSIARSVLSISTTVSSMKCISDEAIYGTQPRHQTLQLAYVGQASLRCIGVFMALCRSGRYRQMRAMLLRTLQEIRVIDMVSRQHGHQRPRSSRR